jgi:hypothetical protein
MILFTAFHALLHKKNKGNLPVVQEDLESTVSFCYNEVFVCCSKVIEGFGVIAREMFFGKRCGAGVEDLTLRIYRAAQDRATQKGIITARCQDGTWDQRQGIIPHR